MSGSKAIFWATIVIATLRDAFTKDSNIELYAYVICGMVVSIAAYLIFERRHHE